VWLAPQQDFTPRPATISPLLVSAPVAVAPGVYLLGKTAPAAVYMVETAEGLVLIDSGIESDAAGVIAQIAELGFDVKSLRAILLTHVHADHSLGAAHLRVLTNATVYAGRADCQTLRRGGPREAFFSTYHMPQLAAHATTVDVELTDGETIAFGDARFQVIATPGHTPGSVCYLLDWQGVKTMFTGDVIQHLDRPGPGDLGTYAAHLAPVYGGDAHAYLESLKRLRALPVPDLVLPGHPQMDTRPQSPHLTLERWRALLDVGIAEIEQLVARYQADGANFLDGTPRELLSGLHYLGNLGPHAVYCLSTPKGLFLFDAPGGPALGDLLIEQVKAHGWQDRKLTAVLLTSADDETIAGLGAVVRQTGCKVVVARPGLERIRHECPPETQVLDTANLDKLDGFRVTTVPLDGRGFAPVAYQFVWAGKTVLVSGRIPVKPGGAALADLQRALGGADARAAEYHKALARLADARPDLWLPAVPTHGQNANLYDREWENILLQNRNAVSW
jgi:glyoxylase-like metal-dependent hydrolase (beta-lactamase superfamily II)